MVAFYNQGDQEIYDEGDQFIPQEYYRLNKFNNTVAPVPPEITQQTTQNFGIPSTDAFTNSGGGGVTFSNTNKFGLNLDTLKSIDQGKWTGSEYEKTPRKIAQDAQGNWKDINTNQNVFHAGINIKTPIQGLLEAVTGKNTGGDPYKDSWYGHGEWDDEEMNIGTRRTVPQNMIQRWNENREIKREKRKADDIAAHNFEAASKINPDILSPNNPLIGKIDHTGGGITRDPGSVVEGAPTHRTRDDLMATGGIVGLAQGGRIGFQPGGPAGGASAGGNYGGNVNPEQEYAGRTFEETYGGNNEPPTDNLNISPFINVEEDKLGHHVPVDLGFAANTKRARLLANLDLRNLNKALLEGKEDETVVNSLADLKEQLNPSLSLNTQIGPVDVNAYKDKNTDYYGVGAQVGNLNLGYKDFNNQKRADISYAPNDKFNIGATTDFDNINLGATYRPNDYFTLGGNIDDQGNQYIGGELKWAFNNGGLVGIL